MRALWDVLKNRMKEPGAIVLAGEKDGKALLIAAGTKQAVEKGFDANDVIKRISPAIGGGGGGKPMMAQAGGKNAGGIDEALDLALNMLL